MNLDQSERDFICEFCNNKIIFGRGHKADCEIFKNRGFKDTITSTLKKHEEIIESAVIDHKPKALFDQGKRSLKELKMKQAQLQGAMLYNSTMKMLNKVKKLTPEEQDRHNKKVELKKQIKLLKKTKGNTEEIKKLKKEMLALAIIK